MEQKTADPANVVKVKGWFANLTTEQEIHCDYYPQPDGEDPHGASWALVQLEPVLWRVLDFIDQSGPGPNAHGAIHDLLEAEEAAGRIAGVRCGFYRHPDRVQADEAAKAARRRIIETRDHTLEPIMQQLEELAVTLHEADPATSIIEHCRMIGREVDRRMQMAAEVRVMEAEGRPVTLFADDDADIEF